MDTLLPKKLSKNDASYKTVEDLNNALSVAEEQNIKNIAITGPFGSGKSSVLYTLMKDFDTKDRELLKTEDIHPPKTGISVHFSGSLV